MNQPIDLLARILTNLLPRGLLLSSILLPLQASPSRADRDVAVRAGHHHDATPSGATEQAATRRRTLITGDDYPAAWKQPDRGTFANISGLNRECVSFASWKIYENSGGRQVPTGRDVPSDWLSFSINVDADWGNAFAWSTFAAANGVRMDKHPTPGSIAQWDKHPSIGMKVGHVGVVKAVHGDGSIDIEQYNLREDGKYSILHMRKNSSAVDTSNGNGQWEVPWPDHFIHIHGR